MNRRSASRGVPTGPVARLGPYPRGHDEVQRVVSGLSHAHGVANAHGSHAAPHSAAPFLLTFIYHVFPIHTHITCVLAMQSPKFYTTTVLTYMLESFLHSASCRDGLSLRMAGLAWHSERGRACV